MTVKELKKALKELKGFDDYEVQILIKELPTKLKTTDCTRIGICIEDKAIVMGFGKCPNCEGEE